MIYLRSMILDLLTDDLRSDVFFEKELSDSSCPWVSSDEVLAYM